ncbi:MAG: amidoligase family protein [Cyclobacteriaceae bacterium]|jgi:hypothetical protein
MRIGFELEFYTRHNYDYLERALAESLSGLYPKSAISKRHLTYHYYDKFYITPESLDAPLNARSRELITPVMPLKKGLKVLDRLLDYVDKVGKTNYSCGLHVNLSFNNMEKTHVEPWKLILNYDDRPVRTFFRRKNNMWCRSIRDNLIRYIKRQDRSLDVDLIFEKLANYMESKYSCDKLLTVNFSKLYDEDEGGWIEFRAIGGHNYQKKRDVVFAEIGRMIESMEFSILDSYSPKVLENIKLAINGEV